MGYQQLLAEDFTDYIRVQFGLRAATHGGYDLYDDKILIRVFIGSASMLFRFDESEIQLPLTVATRDEIERRIYNLAFCAVIDPTNSLDI
jgi:hypothetical protein